MADAHSLFDLTGRVALITGGGGLLGVAHAGALCQSGARVVLSDIDQAALDKAVLDLSDQGYGKLISSRIMDVSDPDSVQQASQDLIAGGLAINILVNNAAIDAKVSADGGLSASDRLETLPLTEWQRQLDVGLTGAFLCAQTFGSRMAAEGGGVILNIASDLSVIAPDQRLYSDPALAAHEQPKKPVTYSVIKTGLVGLTRYLATYWAEQGVRVNALSPGGVQTDQPEEFVQRLSNLIPLGRMARPNEYAGAIQFLCSDAAAYMTGQNVVMDGGRSVL